MRIELIVWGGLALLLIAAVVFTLLLVVPVVPPIWQAVAFVLLAFASIVVYVKYFRDKERPSDQPLLNRRGEQLVGQVYVLDQALVDGRGRIKIGDAYWTAEGEDLPQGARVRVVSAHNMSLQVRAVD